MGMFGFAEAEKAEQEAGPEADARVAARRWLSAQGKRSLYAEFGGLSPPEFMALQSIIGHEGFGVFYSLLQHQRQEWLEQLAKVPLRTPEGAALASVLQGHVQALDQIREMLLDIADPTAQQDEGTK